MKTCSASLKCRCLSGIRSTIFQCWQYDKSIGIPSKTINLNKWIGIYHYKKLRKNASCELKPLQFGWINLTQRERNLPIPNRLERRNRRNRIKRCCLSTGTICYLLHDFFLFSIANRNLLKFVQLLALIPVKSHESVFFVHPYRMRNICAQFYWDFFFNFFDECIEATVN